MGDGGFQRIEVLALDLLQGVGDLGEALVLRRIGADLPRRAVAILICALETRPIPLAREPGEPDAGFMASAAAIETDGAGFQGNAEDGADPLEILINELVPIIMA